MVNVKTNRLYRRGEVKVNLKQLNEGPCDVATKDDIAHMSVDEYAGYWKTAGVEGSTSSWGDITRGVDLIGQVGSFEAGSIAASLGTDLQTVADSIALAASVGVSTDLEALSQGLGYGSFAEAVAAYNAQYGTNYTVEEAAKNLGN